MAECFSSLWKIPASVDAARQGPEERMHHGTKIPHHLPPLPQGSEIRRVDGIDIQRSPHCKCLYRRRNQKNMRRLSTGFAGEGPLCLQCLSSPVTNRATDSCQKTQMHDCPVQPLPRSHCAFAVPAEDSVPNIPTDPHREQQVKAVRIQRVNYHFSHNFTVIVTWL